MVEHTPTVQDRPGQVLALLEEDGQWRSGEDISRLLGISRAAVGKHVASLRTRGHAIESLTRRGYKLLIKNDPLDAPAVQAHLQTRRFGRHTWRTLQETASTNNVAVSLAMEGAGEGLVVFAEKQSQGQGRKGKAWFSAPRGLQFSLVLRPEMSAERLEWLHAIGVIAVVEAVEDLSGLRAEAKIPNDVLLRGKKAAGVLAVTGYRAEEPDWAVLGIGCNVNALAEEFPQELRGKATSVLAEGAGPLSRAALLAAILNRLEYWYDSLASKGLQPVRDMWRERAGFEEQ